MRGEHSYTLRSISACSGSSPLARGALLEAVLLKHHEGIIPACAGSTRGGWPRAGPWRDHPRLRGEHVTAAMSATDGAGSSPLARGALRVGLLHHLAEGIIPACAGSTRSPAAWRRGRRDHPRLRGEHNALLSWGKRVRGSSPLARGAQRTGAGRASHGGSSPLARGAPPTYSASSCPPGIIPACAGSTWPAPSPAAGRGDHPRLRGEHSTAFRPRTHVSGSSPLARGARSIEFNTRTNAGIIPACAGSTLQKRLLNEIIRDHPRLRGEHQLSG